LTYFGPIGALGGFVSDVVQPLAPLSAYVFWASLAASAGLIAGSASRHGDVYRAPGRPLRQGLRFADLLPRGDCRPHEPLRHLWH
jgi:hypothetical protein